MEIISETELKDLTTFFKNFQDLPGKILLFAGTTIIDTPRFIETQLNLLRPDISPVVQKPALDRIRKLRELLENVKKGKEADPITSSSRQPSLHQPLP